MTNETGTIAQSTSKLLQKHTFELTAPLAKSVLLAADFTQWQNHAIALSRTKASTWTATVAVAPGKHAYRFIVDGQWQDDPNCSTRVSNPFGGQDMVFFQSV